MASTPIVEEHLEELQRKVRGNGHKVALTPLPITGTPKATKQPIGKADVINELWAILFVSLIVVSFAMAFGSIAMLVRATLLLFGVQP
jgi:hypothetical protein